MHQHIERLIRVFITVLAFLKSKCVDFCKFKWKLLDFNNTRKRISLLSLDMQRWLPV